MRSESKSLGGTLRSTRTCLGSTKRPIKPPQMDENTNKKKHGNNPQKKKNKKLNSFLPTTPRPSPPSPTPPLPPDAHAIDKPGCYTHPRDWVPRKWPRLSKLQQKQIFQNGFICRKAKKAKHYLKKSKITQAKPGFLLRRLRQLLHPTVEPWQDLFGGKPPKQK